MTTDTAERPNFGPIDGSLIPTDLSAEESVIGSLLLDREAIVRVSGRLRPEHFWSEALGAVYAAIDALYDRRIPADTVTVVDELRSTGALEMVGGPAALAGIIAKTPTAAHVLHYARIVEHNATLRAIISAGGEISAVGLQRSHPAPLQAAEEVLARVAQTQAQEYVSIAEVVDRYAEDRKAGRLQLRGVPTGFAHLDAVLGGLRPGNLYLIGARTGVGKTALAGTLMRNAARRGYGVGAVELEMANSELGVRLLAQEFGLDFFLIGGGYLTDDEEAQLQRAEARLATLPIYIDDTFATSAPDVRRRTLRLMSEASIDLLIVDYIQLLDAPGRGGGSRSSRVQEVSEISAELRKLAKELDIPIVALAQLNREVEKRGGNGGKEHKLSDLRESGSLEQDAAIVIFIHMEQLYDPDTYKEGIAELVVAKHRHGRLARVPVRWCPRTAEFRDLALVPGGYGALGRSVVK